MSHVASQGITFGIELLLDTSDDPHIFLSVLEPVRGLSYARRSDAGWEVQLVEAGDLWQPAADLDAADRIHLVYYDADVGALVYGNLAGEEWFLQTVEDDASDLIRIGRQPSIAIDASGRAHVSYYYHPGWERTRLRYAVSSRVGG